MFSGYLGFDFGFWIFVLKCYCALIPKLEVTMIGWLEFCVPEVLGGWTMRDFGVLNFEWGVYAATYEF